MALAAIVTPPLLRRLDEQAFQAAAESTVQQLLLARAHAQLESAPVEIVYLAGEGVVVARRFEPQSLGGDDGGVRLDTQGDTAIPEPWAVRALPDGVRLQPGPPRQALPDDTPSDEPPPADLRLAVFVPDGSALIAAQAWFTDNAGRTARLTVNPYTGLAHAE